MNPMLAAGLFDSPWIVAAIVIVGAFVNWLSQLRQQKQQREEERRQSQESTTESPQKPKGAFDVEEALRRLLGEETLPTSVPPPIPRFPGGPPPPPPVWRDRVTTPVLVPPPIVTALPDVSREISDVETQTELRFAQTREQIEHHRELTIPGHRAGTSKWSGLWRDRQSVRRAFVGSLIFGPPKGLES